MSVYKSGSHYFSLGVNDLCVLTDGFFAERANGRDHLIGDGDFRLIDFTGVDIKKPSVFNYHIGRGISKSYIDYMIVHFITSLVLESLYNILPGYSPVVFLS